jgi:hypothetical protein
VAKLLELETVLLLKPTIRLILETSFKEFPQATPTNLQSNISMKKVAVAYALQANPIVGMETLQQISWVLVSIIDPIIKHLKAHGSETALTLEGVPREMLGGFIPVLASYFMAFDEWKNALTSPVPIEPGGMDPRVQAATYFIQQLEGQLETLGYPNNDPFVISAHAQLANLRERLGRLCAQVLQEAPGPQAHPLMSQEEE